MASFTSLSHVSSSSTTFATFLISNIVSPVSVKLENHNHLLWKSQFLPVLCANRLAHVVGLKNIERSVAGS